MKLDYENLLAEYDGEEIPRKKPKVKSKFKDIDKVSYNKDSKKKIRKQRQEKQKRRERTQEEYEGDEF